jgi:hypothetical protein
VTSVEQSDAMERGAGWALPVGCDVPASSPIGLFMRGEVVDAVDVVRLLGIPSDVFEHATNAAATASIRQTRSARNLGLRLRGRLAVTGTRTMRDIIAATVAGQPQVKGPAFFELAPKCALASRPNRA